MRWIVRLAAIVVVGLAAILLLGPMAPADSFFHDLSAAFSRGLRVQWAGPLAG